MCVDLCSHECSCFASHCGGGHVCDVKFNPIRDTLFVAAYTSPSVPCADPSLVSCSAHGHVVFTVCSQMKARV